jgi:hypothetical protein
VKRTIKATLRAIDFLKEPKNQNEVVAIIRDWFKVESDLAQASYPQMVDIYPASGMVTDEAIAKDLEMARQVGGIQGRCSGIACS